MYIIFLHDYPKAVDCELVPTPIGKDSCRHLAKVMLTRKVPQSIVAFSIWIFGSLGK